MNWTKRGEFELLENALQGRSPCRRIGIAELALVDVQIVVPPFGVEGWELGHGRLRSLRLEELVDHDVRVGVGGLVFGAEAFGPRVPGDPCQGRVRAFRSRSGASSFGLPCSYADWHLGPASLVSPVSPNCWPSRACALLCSTHPTVGPVRWHARKGVASSQSTGPPARSPGYCVVRFLPDGARPVPVDGGVDAQYGPPEG